ncbi:MAG: type VII toxin-antitoxin system HepT family RNase toxin [Anaerolineae bacterium]
MSLNEDLLKDRFDDIRQSLARLERFRSLSLEAFLADQDALDVACYRLLVAMEAALQICFHISAQELNQVPEHYAECFAILGNGGVLPPDLSRNLQRMARFRNMLVHVYWEIDYEQVYVILQEHLDDLRAFVRAVGELL